MKTRTFRAAKAAAVAAAVAGLAAIVAGLGTPALAWNKPGHMVSGSIAYQELRRTNPQVLGRIVALLKQHPDYERLWRARVQDAQAAGIDEAEALLMQAARWPDDARSRLRGREGWHYINLPYAPNGGPAPQPPPVNILSAYQTNLDLVRSGNGLPPGRQGQIARAEALCSGCCTWASATCTSRCTRSACSKRPSSAAEPAIGAARSSTSVPGRIGRPSPCTRCGTTWS
jgi:hypothetical protein